MEKLIKASELRQRLEYYSSHNVEGSEAQYAYELAIKELDERPAVDADPVVHAHWEWVPINEHKWELRCGNCGNGEYCAEVLPRCPWCGAHMDTYGCDFWFSGGEVIEYARRQE